MVTYVQQDAWHWMLALYLFLGGLGGAIAALGIGVDRYVKPNPRVGLIAALSSFGLLILGTIILFLDLMQPLKAIWFWANPGSWIFLGILSLAATMVGCLLYALPYMKEWPVIGSIASQLAFLEGWQRWTGFVSVACGVTVTAYTGFLLAASQGIALWHSAGLPVLFMVSAFSTGCAYMMLALWRTREEDKSVVHGFAKLDAALIGVEIVVLISIYNASVNTGAAGVSVEALLGNSVFVVGFLLLGLLIPLAIELYEFTAKEGSKGHQLAVSLVPIASVFILTGGYFLRHFVLWGGYYSYPW